MVYEHNHKYNGRRDQEESSSSSNDSSTNLSLQQNDNSIIFNEEFSDLDDEPTPLTSRSQPESLQNMTVGQYVLVNYEGNFIRGRSPRWKKKDEILITAMQKSGAYWEWPTKPDEIYYSRDEIVQLIKMPKQLGRRGIYTVKELRACNC